MKGADGCHAILVSKRRDRKRGNAIVVVLEGKYFPRNIGIAKSVARSSVQKISYESPDTRRKLFSPLINPWIVSLLLTLDGSREALVSFSECGSSHLTIPSRRSRKASVGSHARALSRLRNFQRKRGDVREHPTTADRREEHDGAIIRDNRGFCECRKVVDDSALEPLNRAMSAREDYRWINLCPMNIEAIFADGEERSSYFRTEGNEREALRSSWWASVNKRGTGGGARLPSASGLPFWRKEPPGAEQQPAPSMRFLIVDEIPLETAGAPSFVSSFDRRFTNVSRWRTSSLSLSRQWTRSLGSWSLRRKYESHRQYVLSTHLRENQPSAPWSIIEPGHNSAGWRRFDCAMIYLADVTTSVTFSDSDAKLYLSICKGD